jgi:hypothetical protein
MVLQLGGRLQGDKTCQKETQSISISNIDVEAIVVRFRMLGRSLMLLMAMVKELTLQ